MSGRSDEGNDAIHLDLSMRDPFSSWNDVEGGDTGAIDLLFQRGGSNCSLHPDQVAILKHAYKLFVKSCSAVAGPSNMVAVFQSLGINVSEEEVSKLFQGLGTNGSMDFPEFLTLTSTLLMTPQNQKEYYSEAFDLFADGQKMLSLKKLQSLLLKDSGLRESDVQTIFSSFLPTDSTITKEQFVDLLSTRGYQL